MIDHQNAEISLYYGSDTIPYRMTQTVGELMSPSEEMAQRIVEIFHSYLEIRQHWTLKQYRKQFEVDMHNLNIPEDIVEKMDYWALVKERVQHKTIAIVYYKPYIKALKRWEEMYAIVELGRKCE